MSILLETTVNLSGHTVNLVFSTCCLHKLPSVCRILPFLKHSLSPLCKPSLRAHPWPPASRLLERRPCTCCPLRPFPAATNTMDVSKPSDLAVLMGGYFGERDGKTVCSSCEALGNKKEGLLTRRSSCVCVGGVSVPCHLFHSLIAALGHMSLWARVKSLL